MRARRSRLFLHSATRLDGARRGLYAGQPMTSSNRAAIGLGEFVGLMATLTALVAMSIDMVLPALPAIGASLGVERANDRSEERRVGKECRSRWSPDQ